jgi:hypothetical protein
MVAGNPLKIVFLFLFLKHWSPVAGVLHHEGRTHSRKYCYQDGNEKRAIVLGHLHNTKEGKTRGDETNNRK